MTRKINKLSPREVASISKQGRYADGGGLYLQVGPAKNKAWLFRFTLHGKAREMGLGALKTISLKEARERAGECRRQLLDGYDPIEERNRLRRLQQADKIKSKTFKWCAREYINAHEASWKNAKHAAQWTSTLEAYAYQTIGDLSVADIDTNLIVQILDPIWSSKTETANRVRNRIEAILDWAKVRGYRKDENPARWKGHLSNVFPSRSKIQVVKHHPALPFAEAGAFMVELRSMQSIAAYGLELLILTAARTSEVIGATWDEIDLEGKSWAIPAERMKAQKPHIIPFSKPAIDVLKELLKLRQSVFVLPGQRENRPLSNMAFLKLLERMGRKDLTVHGFRSTFRDWVAECTHFPREAAEMALAHTVGNKVEEAYRRGDLREKRRLMMDDWAQYLSRAEHTSSNNIVAIETRKKRK